MKDAEATKEQEAARLAVLPALDGLELLSARYREHAYSLHTHPTYVVGVVTAGVEALRVESRGLVAPVGALILVNPEAPHDGERGCEAGWSYRTCYPSVALMREIAEDLGAPAPPAFAGLVLEAPEIAGAFVQAHRLSQGDDALAAETAMLAALRALIRRFGDRRPAAPRRDEAGALRRFRRYRDLIEADPAASFDLARLAETGGVTRFQVVRDFKRGAGMTPGQYLRDRRIRRASGLLSGETPLAEIAAAVGFSDQSHFSRVFKAVRGLSPGAWRAALSAGA